MRIGSLNLAKWGDNSWRVLMVVPFLTDQSLLYSEVYQYLWYSYGKQM